MRKVLIVSLALLTVFLVSCGNTGNGIAGSTNLDAFAECLAENGATMYGAEWCSHCKDQKAMFGSSFKNVDYVECTVEQQKCAESGISGYPSWVFSDGSILAGVQQFSTLAKKTGCVLN